MPKHTARKGAPLAPGAKTVTGEGSIVQLEKDKPKSRCRKWQLRVPIGRDPATGKYRTRTRRFTGTYTEAKKALREFIEEIEGGRIQDRTEWTFKDYSDVYMEGRIARGEVAPLTLERQKADLKRVCRHIGGLKLDEITPEIVARTIDAMAKGETATGTPASSGTLRLDHIVIRQVLEDAREKGILVSNPCEGLKVPSGQPSEERKAMNETKAHEFAEELDPTEPCELAYLLAVTTGMRRGEIAGLSWGDIDFDKSLLYVRHAYDTLGNFKDPKTGSGKRILPLSDFTTDALRKAKEALAEKIERKAKEASENGEEAHNPKWLGPWKVLDDSTAVIVNASGTRATPDSISYWWKRDRSGFGLGAYTFHELRHTYLTLLAEKGVHPRVMQELAGHSKPEITMMIYTHVNMDAKRSAVEAVSQVF